MQNLSERTILPAEIIAKELAYHNAQDILTFTDGVKFHIGERFYWLSTINQPSVSIEKTLPFPEKYPYEFEQAALRANDRDSAVKVRVNREEEKVILSTVILCPTLEYFSRSLDEYLKALDNAELIVSELYRSTFQEECER